MKGYGLFVGVDYCDSNHYTDSNLFREAKADAYAYDDMAKKTGLFSEKNRAVLTGKDATWKKCEKVLLEYAEISKQEEGYLLLAFSAHGWSHKPKVLMRTSNGETIERVEFFSFYDRMVLEHEVREILEKFSENFKVVLIVNACNSGGMFMDKSTESINTEVGTEERTFKKHSVFYEDILNRYGNNTHQNYKADVFKFASSLPNKVAAKGGVATNLSNYTEYFMTVWKSEPFWGNYFTLNNILVNGLQKKNEPHVWPDFLDSPDFFKRTVPFHFNCMARCVTSNDYMQWNIKTSEFDGESIKYQVTSPNPNYRIRDLDFLEYKEIGKRPIEKAYLEKERIKAHFIIILAINLANTYQYSEKWFSNSNLKTTAVGTGKTGIIIIYDQDHSRVLGYKTLEKELVLNN